MCRDDFFGKGPFEVSFQVAADDGDAAYYLSVTETPRRMDFEPNKMTYSSAQLAAGITFTAKPQAWYDIALVCSNGAALRTAIRLRMRDVSPPAPCSAPGGGLAGYWTITTWG